MTRIKGKGKALAASIVVLLAAAMWLFVDMSRKDAEHAGFYNTGKTVNDFLRGYCDDLEAAFAGADATALRERYASAYASPGRGRWTWGPVERQGDVSMRPLRAVGADSYDRDALFTEISAYLGGLARIDRTICKIDLIEDVELDWSVRLTVKFILDGVDHQGLHFQDRVFYRWHLLDDGTGWRIVRDELVEGIRVAGAAETFAAVDPTALGIAFEHRRDPKMHMKKHRGELRFGIMQHVSGGISAADYSGDGRSDLLFLSGVDSRLYRNEGTGDNGWPAFTDVTAAAGLEGIGEAHAALFADYDNDGDRDLFVGRYLAPNLFFRNDGGGTFSDVSAEMGVDFAAPVASGTLLDYDIDGDLDIYLAVYGNAFEAFPRLPFYARNGQPNRLLRNESGAGFTDVTGQSGTGDTGWSLAVAAADYDGDGDPDIGLANDFGRKALYRNDGDGTFSEVAKGAGVLDFSGGMGLAFADFNDDGFVDLYTSNINSNQRWFGEDRTVSQYTRNILRSRWFLADFSEYWSLYGLLGPRWIELGKQVGEGNSLFSSHGGGADGIVTFEELKGSRTDRAGWSWGVAWLDYDNDTDLDLYAANGWISNTPGTDL